MKSKVFNTLAIAATLGALFSAVDARADDYSMLDTVKNGASDAVSYLGDGISSSYKKISASVPSVPSGVYVSAAYENGVMAGEEVFSANTQWGPSYDVKWKQYATNGYTLSTGWAPAGNGFGWDVGYTSLTVPGVSYAAEDRSTVAPQGAIKTKTLDVGFLTISATGRYALTENFFATGKLGVALNSPYSADAERSKELSYSLRYSIGGEYQLKEIMPIAGNSAVFAEYSAGGEISGPGNKEVDPDRYYGIPKTWRAGVKYTF